MHAMVVAAESEDRDFFSFALRHAGLAVAQTGSVQHLPSALQDHGVDLILLVLDPRQRAVDEVHRIRQQTQAPLITVVENMTEADHCSLLDAGADLILNRPLSSRLLVRYARMLLRRAGSVPASVLPVIEAGDLVLDPESREVHQPEQKQQRLTPLEFRLLYLLMTHQGQVLSADIIVDRVWGYDGEGNSELVRGLVRRLRRKIEPDATTPRYIENLPGVGYRFTASP